MAEEMIPIELGLFQIPQNNLNNLGVFFNCSSDPNASTGLLAEEALIVLLSRARKGDPVTLEDHVALDVSRNISP